MVLHDDTIPTIGANYYVPRNVISILEPHRIGSEINPLNIHVQTKIHPKTHARLPQRRMTISAMTHHPQVSILFHTLLRGERK